MILPAGSPSNVTDSQAMLNVLNFSPILGNTTSPCLGDVTSQHGNVSTCQNDVTKLCDAVSRSLLTQATSTSCLMSSLASPAKENVHEDISSPSSPTDAQKKEEERRKRKEKGGGERKEEEKRKRKEEGEEKEGEEERERERGGERRGGEEEGKGEKGKGKGEKKEEEEKK